MLWALLLAALQEYPWAHSARRFPGHSEGNSFSITIHPGMCAGSMIFDCLFALDPEIVLSHITINMMEAKVWPAIPPHADAGNSKVGILTTVGDFTGAKLHWEDGAEPVDPLRVWASARGWLVHWSSPVTAGRRFSCAYYSLPERRVWRASDVVCGHVGRESNARRRGGNVLKVVPGSGGNVLKVVPDRA